MQQNYLKHKGYELPKTNVRSLYLPLVSQVPCYDIKVRLRTLADNIFIQHVSLTDKRPVREILMDQKIEKRKRKSPDDSKTDSSGNAATGGDDDIYEYQEALTCVNVDELRELHSDKSYTENEFVELLVQLENKFIYPFQQLNGEKLKQHMHQLFELHTFPDRPFEMRDIEAGYRVCIYQIYQVYLLFVKHGLVGLATEDTIYNMRIFNRLLEIVYQMKQMIAGEYQLYRAVHERQDQESDINLFRFTPQDFSKNQPFQNLLIFLLHSAYQRGYRLYKNGCYTQIYHNGYATHAWKYECKVEAFVYTAIDKATNYEMWLNLTSAKDNAKHAANILIASKDKEFPTLEPDRHMWSFEDGIYNAMTMSFHPYDVDPLPSDVVTVKFFESKFNPELLFGCEDWYDIPTPDFQHILEYQKLPQEVCKVVYMMCGRCLYYVNEMDRWEVIMFIKGVAGSGKSTIGKVLKNFYPTDDVAILSSNIEPRFGLQGVYDKLLYLCLEVKRNFGLDQGDFQSMISGEEVSVAIKNKTAIPVLWQVPGMLMGNEVAARWVDAAGSMTRRIVCLDFNQRVRSSDTSLMKKLKASMPAFIHKCNLAYRAAVDEIQNSSLWEHLPKYFIDEQKRFSKEINPLEEFLEQVLDTELVLAPDKYMPYQEFQNRYVNFLKKTSRGHIHFGEDHYRTSFESHGLQVTRKESREYRGENRTAHWITGITEIFLSNNGGGGDNMIQIT